MWLALARAASGTSTRCSSRSSTRRATRTTPSSSPVRQPLLSSLCYLPHLSPSPYPPSLPSEILPISWQHPLHDAGGACMRRCPACGAGAPEHCCAALLSQQTRQPRRWSGSRKTTWSACGARTSMAATGPQGALSESKAQVWVCRSARNGKRKTGNAWGHQCTFGCCRAACNAAEPANVPCTSEEGL